MAGSYFGNILRVTTFGESHGAGVGAVLDGFPAGMELTNEDIQEYLDRRKPGRNSISTPRKEDDLVEILSGTFEGKTTPRSTASRMFSGVPTPIRYVGLFFGRCGTTSSRTLYICS